MEGDRGLFGTRFGRKGFDRFLWVVAGWYGALLVWSIWRVGVWSFDGLLFGLWVEADVALLGVAWMSARGP
jgi:hypothetical protein